jgi:hypothetical protein
MPRWPLGGARVAHPGPTQGRSSRAMGQVRKAQPWKLVCSPGGWCGQSQACMADVADRRPTLARRCTTHGEAKA